MAGTLVISTLSDGTNSTSSTNCIRGSAKAWVSFGGGNGSTAGAINSSYNVSSITVVGSGQWQVNMTSAMSDTNYAPLASHQYDNAGSWSVGTAHVMTTPATTSYFLITGSYTTSNTYLYSYIVTAAVFR